MECSQATGIFGDLGALDETLCVYILLFHLGEWLTPRRMVSAATWDSAGMSTCPSLIHSGCGYIGLLHDTTMLEWSPIGFSDDKHLRGHTSIAVCGRHHVFYSRIGNRSPHPISDDGGFH